MAKLMRKGKVVKVGDKVTDFRGDKFIVIGWEEPRHPGSTGRVLVKMENGTYDERYYPSVFDMYWVGRKKAAA